jgi:hypothetical protein
LANQPANRQDGDVWPPQKIEVELSHGEAVVLYELLRRYQESRKPDLVTDRAEWYALVLLCGALERSGAAEIPDYDKVLENARSELGSYDGVPF